MVEVSFIYYLFIYINIAPFPKFFVSYKCKVGDNQQTIRFYRKGQVS